MKKAYIQPAVSVITMHMEQMIATSFTEYIGGGNSSLPEIGNEDSGSGGGSGSGSYPEFQSERFDGEDYWQSGF